jgi:hypothetical protein
MLPLQENSYPAAGGIILRLPKCVNKKGKPAELCRKPVDKRQPELEKDSRFSPTIHRCPVVAYEIAGVGESREDAAEKV